MRRKFFVECTKSRVDRVANGLDDLSTPDPPQRISVVAPGRRGLVEHR
jgi:hypothetical protein